MRFKTNASTVNIGDDFIDAFGEEQAPVKDRDVRFMLIDILIVEINNHDTIGLIKPAVECHSNVIGC